MSNKPQLDKSWEDLCKEIGDPNLESSQCKCWLLGATRFQMRAIEELEKQLNEYNDVDIDMTYEHAIQIIKNLKENAR